jgi:hypothetical protein
MKREFTQADLHEQFGYRPLNRTWAKLEIFLGLSAAGVGLFLGHSAWQSEQFWRVGAGLALFVLGGYHTLAGHRSHLYQSSNEQTAYLVRLINDLKDKGRTS